MRILVHHYEAFSTTPGMGNPAGVVLGHALSAEQMQAVARQVGFNETVFVTSIRPGVISLRYFTPGHETDLCGHATVAAFVALQERALLPPVGTRPTYRLEVKAGELRVEVEAGVPPLVWLDQPNARFVPYGGTAADAAEMIGLAECDLADGLPIVYGNTGLWTLIVPVKGLEAMRRMSPATASFPSVLKEWPRASVHPFCLETVDPACDMHGRHFSSPHSGTVEDPVTGTASGVMGAYHATHVSRGGAGPWRFRIEQGQEIGRDGRVHVLVGLDKGEYSVRMGGSGVYVGDLDIEL